LDNALAAAEQGFRVWSRTSPAKRAEMICAATKLMRERIEDMAYATTLEQGKLIAQSRLEIRRGCEIMEWDAREGRSVECRPATNDSYNSSNKGYRCSPREALSFDGHPQFHA
jgi:acyl-CoA reductase-like NAD-dependent aldehyde dehydrogenase